MDPILIVTVPHASQRYDTVGDYLSSPMVTTVRVSDCDDDRMEFCIAIHELIEQRLCRHRGISDAAIDAFDETFTGEGEPGDARDAPYHREHVFATMVERWIARELDLSWQDYERRLQELTDAATLRREA